MELNKFRKEAAEEINQTKKPVEVKINEMNTLYYGAGYVKIGKFKRKAKGKEYCNPRILLHWFFSKYIGKNARVFEGKVSIEDWPAFQNVDAILIVFPHQELSRGR